MKKHSKRHLRPHPSECPHCGRSGDNIEPTTDGGWICTECEKTIGNHL